MYDDLTQALHNILFRLERDNVSRFVAAAASFQGIQGYTIPAHVKVTPRQPSGPRLSEQFGHHTELTSRVIRAHWPEDATMEVTVPVVVFVLSGQTDLRIADYTLHCQVGDVIFIPPNVASADSRLPHLDEPTEGRHCDLLWIQPVFAGGGGGVQCYACRSQGSVHSSPWPDGSCHVHHPATRQILETLAEEIEESGITPLTYTLLKSLAYLLLREVKANRIGSLEARLPSHQPLVLESDTIEFVKTYIDSHLHHDLSIDLLAGKAFLSRAAFTSKFRQQTGKTVNKYLTDLRMERAAMLLSETSFTIQKIAETIGLQDRQFRNLFRQHYQCSPLEWRSQKKR